MGAARHLIIAVMLFNLGHAQNECKAFNRLLGAYQNVSGITTLKDCFTSCVKNASCIAYYYNILPDCKNYILNTTISNPAQSGVVSYNICPNDPSQCLSSTKLTANIITVSANKTCYQTCLENPICVGSYSVNGKCRNDYLNGTLIDVSNDSKVEAFVRCRMMDAPTTTTTTTTVETTTTTSTTLPTTTTTTEETTTTEPTTSSTTTDEKTNTAAPSYPTNTPEPCNEKADIVVLLDASTSIGADNWNNLTQTAANITQYFDVGPDKVRFASMTFNRKPTVQFNLKDHLDHDSLSQALQAIAYPGVYGTKTYLALQDITNTNMFGSEAGGRDDAPDNLIIFTDGQSDQTQRTLEAATKLKEAGVSIITVGVGSNPSQEELKGIASAPENAFNAVNSDFREKIINTIVKKSCQTVEISN